MVTENEGTKPLVTRGEISHNVFKGTVTDVPEEDIIDAIVILEGEVENLPMKDNVGTRAQLIGKHPLDISEHVQLVAAFNKLAGSEVSNTIHIPDADTRILRAKLILEEALEAIETLGVEVSLNELSESTSAADLTGIALEMADFEFTDMGTDKVDVVGLAKECCDVRVVTTGTLVAFGIPDTYALQNFVDTNNILKFRKDKDGYKREDGKWCKPSDHPKPKIAEFLALYGWKQK